MNWNWINFYNWTTKLCLTFISLGQIIYNDDLSRDSQERKNNWKKKKNTYSTTITLIFFHFNIVFSAKLCVSSECVFHPCTGSQFTCRPAGLWWSCPSWLGWSPFSSLCWASSAPSLAELQSRSKVRWFWVEESCSYCLVWNPELWVFLRMAYLTCFYTFASTKMMFVSRCRSALWWFSRLKRKLLYVPAVHRWSLTTVIKPQFLQYLNWSLIWIQSLNLLNYELHNS